MYSLILNGKRLVRLQKWPKLTFVVQNAFIFSNSFSSSNSVHSIPGVGYKEKNFRVSYLVDSLGLAKKLAESISRKVSFEDTDNTNSVLSLLRTYGFKDSQISSIITKYPRLLTLDAEKSVGPKLQFLQSRGASNSELICIVSTVPKILGVKHSKSISRYYDFVKVIIEADKSSKFEKLCHSFPQRSQQDNKIRNISTLRDLGMPQKLLFSLLFGASQPVCGKERFEESLKKVVEMGFDPKTAKFARALHVFYQMSDNTIKEKVNLYKRLGFTLDEIWSIFKKWPLFLRCSEEKITQTFATMKMCGFDESEGLQVLKKHPQLIGLSEQKILSSIESFLGLGFSRDEVMMIVKRYPMCVNLSEETLKKKIEFLVKKMNWPLQSVISSPAGLGYSLEKRIVPRCNVINTLMSKGLIGSEIPPMSTVLSITDQAFLDMFVMKNDKPHVTELLTIFTGNSVS